MDDLTPADNVAPLDQTDRPAEGTPTDDFLSKLSTYLTNYSLSVFFNGLVKLGTRLWLPNQSADPTVCNVGELAVIGGALKVCSAANTWTDLTPVTDAHIRGLLSGVSPISYNASTGAISVGASTSLSDATLLAAEAISLGQPVAVGPYQSDGGVTLDTKSGADVSATGFTYTESFTVGNHSNRVLIVITSAAESLAASYNGVSMTKLTTNGVPGGQTVDVFYLLAPTIGINNLVITGLQSNEEFGRLVYSYYNAAQSAPTKTEANNSSVSSLSQSVTPAHVASVLLTAVASSVNIASHSYTLVGMSGNQVAAFSVGGAGSGGALMSGDSFKVATAIAKTMSATISAGLPNLLMATLEIAPATAATYRASKASGESASNYNYDVAWKANNFYGFAVAAYALGATVTATTSGVDANQTGLTVGIQYYLATTAGALSTTSVGVARKVGISLSTTQILVTNTW